MVWGAGGRRKVQLVNALPAGCRLQPQLYGTPALATKITHLVRLLHSLQVVLWEVGGGGGCRLCKREEEQWGW